MILLCIRQTCLLLGPRAISTISVMNIRFIFYTIKFGELFFRLDRKNTEAKSEKEY